MYQRALRLRYEIEIDHFPIIGSTPNSQSTLVGRFCKGLFIQRHDEEISRVELLYERFYTLDDIHLR